MAILSILVFFAVTYALGYSVAGIAKESENFLERILMRIGIGLGAFIVLGLLLNILRVPLDWRVFLGIGFLLAALSIFRNRSFMQNIKTLQFKITKTDIAIFAILLIFFASFYMYAKGAFSYPWLEDDDPWAHALGVKYISAEKTAFTKSRVKYVDPYPPSYDMVMGILHQTNDSVYWTLKFFNALIISLGIVFFFFFAKELTGSKKALFSAFALASAPAFLSHFIWAISLTVPMYFVSFYAVERIRYDKKWVFIAAAMIGATLTTSPSHSAYFGLLFAVYYVAKAILEKSILVYYAAAGFFGLLISFLLWWLPSIIKYGFSGMLRGMGLGSSQKITSVAGTGDRIYNLQDFFIAQKTNAINNPIGIGLVLSLLLIVALLSLMHKYYNEIKKNKLMILAIFLVIAVATLFFLSKTYVKNVTNRATGYAAALEPGSVPFFEFFSDQRFLVINLLLMIFVFVSIIVISYKNKDFKDGYLVIALAWLIFAFYAVNAGPFYYKLSPFRAWSVFAIPLAILASEGLWFLMSLLKNFNAPKFLVAIIIVTGVALTSSYQKYTVNTAQWPPGAFWTSGEELQGYLWLKDNISPNTKVFAFVNDGTVIGMDKFICFWCDDIKSFKNTAINQSASKINSFLKTRSYKFLVIDGQFARKYGMNKTNSKVSELLGSGMFKSVYGTGGFVFLEVI
ncbi:hypothetical protein HYY71_00485 [Candidatus Woesearchaeota archaeon]|nr:hypothetical protein [Candidatus Woesearchaeota archaeon]